MPEIRIEIVISVRTKLLILSTERVKLELKESMVFKKVAINTAITNRKFTAVTFGAFCPEKLCENVCVIAVDNL